MGLATLLAWQLQLYEPQQPTIDIQLDPSNEYTTNIDLNDEKQQATGTANAAETSCHNATVFAQTNRSLPEWVIVFKHFKTPNCIAFLLVAWIMGVGMGLIFSFLFWHLQVNKGHFKGKYLGLARNGGKESLGIRIPRVVQSSHQRKQNQGSD